MEQLPELFSSPALYIFLVILVTLKKSFYFVPQNRGYVIYRLGKYNRTLHAGFNVIVPFVEAIAGDRNLKEQVLPIPSQGAITKDNITLHIDGVLFIKVTDAAAATNNINNYKNASMQLAMTSMRNAIGGMELDECFQQRDKINAIIQEVMSGPSQPWGVQILRYEIKDIEPPKSVMEDMEKQMTAERAKRAVILESEGDKTSAINIAEGDKTSRVLAAEADKAEKILAAEGEAAAIETVATATAKALKSVGEVADTAKGQKAITLKLAEGAIDAQKLLANPSEGKLILSENGGANAIPQMLAQVLAIADQVNSTIKPTKAKAK